MTDLRYTLILSLMDKATEYENSDGRDPLEVWADHFGTVGDSDGQTTLWLRDPVTVAPAADEALEIVLANIWRELHRG